MIAWLPLAKSFLEEDKSISISVRYWSQVCWFQNYNAHETIITLIQFILALQNHEQVNIILEEEKQIKTNNIIYDFDNMKIQDLKLFCKTNNINNYSKLRKKDLINKIKLELKK